jgi:hypothetical protein
MAILMRRNKKFYLQQDELIVILLETFLMVWKQKSVLAVLNYPADKSR